MPDPPSFTTKRRSIASDGTLSWGDSETSWRDSVAQSDRVSFDTGNPRPFGDVPDDGSIESFERDTLQYYGKFEAKASPFRAGMKPTNSIQPPTMA